MSLLLLLQGSGAAPSTEADAELAAATGAALNPAVALVGNLEASTATGTAFTAVASLIGNAETATATGTGLLAATRISANLGAAEGAGTAADATGLTGEIGNAETATATGEALNAGVVIVANFSMAEGTGEGLGVAVSIAVNVGIAEATGSASDLTVPAPTWTTPADGAPMSATPELKFTIPAASGAQHFWMELDTAATFDTGDLQVIRSDLDQTGWDYWNGAGWEPVTLAGVPVDYIGNEGRYIVQAGLAGTTWYRRVRAGIVA